MPPASRPPDLASLCAAFPRAGVVTWIGIRPRRREPVTVVHQVGADPERGLEGDHYSGRRHTARQVTLVQAEHLPVIASFTRLPAIDTVWLRRNILVEGINLLALTRFRVGPVLGTSDLFLRPFCGPWSARMQGAARREWPGPSQEL